jgi:hypothetical protein
MGELLLTTTNPSGASGQGCGALWSFMRSGFRFIEAGTIAASRAAWCDFVSPGMSGRATANPKRTDWLVAALVCNCCDE